MTLRSLLHVAGLLVLADEGLVGGGVQLRAARRPAVAAPLAVLGDFRHFHGNGFLRDEDPIAQPDDQQQRHDRPTVTSSASNMLEARS